LWITEKRFNKKYLDKILPPDFFEFGRSGRVYTREKTLSSPTKKNNVNLSLKDFKIHPIKK